MKGNDEMKNRKLQVALIGCGMIGHGHAEGVARDGRAEIAAVVYGKNRAAAEDFAKKYGIPFVTDDYREVIERGGIDVAIVATPNACHAEATIAFANAGVHVLCEKPLDVEIDKMTAMIDAAEKNNVLLGCVFPNRTRDDLIRAKEIIDSGELGRMLMVEFQYRGYRSHSYYNSSNWKGTKAGDGGGCLINQGSHGIDALVFLAGGVKSVCAVCDTMARKIDVEDAACALLEFDSGAHGTLMGTTLSHFPEANSECERIRIEFERGTVVYADGKTVLYKSLSDDELKVEEICLTDKIESFGANPEDMDMAAHYAIVSNFIDGVLDGKKLIAPARDARRAVDLVLSIYKSAETRAWVDVPKFDMKI